MRSLRPANSLRSRRAHLSDYMRLLNFFAGFLIGFLIGARVVPCMQVRGLTGEIMKMFLWV
jgi:hypothetical protein